MKKTITILVSIALLLVTLAACKKQEATQVTKLEFTSKSYSISERGDMNMKKALVFETSPAEAAASQKIVWTVSDESVAEMSGNYLIPIKAGTVKVTATVLGASASCEVIIEPVAITKITLSTDAPERLYIGQSALISLSVEPADANKENVSLSYDSKVVDVEKTESGDIKVTAKAVGNAVIKASYGSVDDAISFDIAVNEITALKLSSEDYIITIGYSKVLEPEITVQDPLAPPTYPKLLWEVTAGSEFVKLDENGKLTGVAASNSVMIRVVYEHDKKILDGARVKVVNPKDITSYTIEREKSFVNYGEDIKVYIASYTPSDGNIEAITWGADSPEAKYEGLYNDGRPYALFSTHYLGGGDVNVIISSQNPTTHENKSVTVKVNKSTPDSFKLTSDKSLYYVASDITKPLFWAKITYSPAEITDPYGEFALSAEKYKSRSDKTSSTPTDEIKFGDKVVNVDGSISVPVTCTNPEGWTYKIKATSSTGYFSYKDIEIVKKQ